MATDENVVAFMAHLVSVSPELSSYSRLILRGALDTPRRSLTNSVASDASGKRRKAKKE